MKVKVFLAILSVGWVNKKYGLFESGQVVTKTYRMAQGAGKSIMMGFEDARQKVLGRIECV